MALDLVLAVTEDGADDVRLDEHARLLREEFLDLDLTAVPATDGPAPQGTRGDLAATAGALALTVPGLDVLRGVVLLVHDWLSRAVDQRVARTVTVELAGDRIELTGASGELQQQLVDAWLRRHATATE
ncbi:hypothetical protein [Nocardioides speluncae]|uniref:hypothetical protein n=1 Tax=Nocardioides speluncae TaxID=2670337 RepID=UPI000D689C07|nr:hypothetical protein [Nocardioides speluncae]